MRVIRGAWERYEMVTVIYRYPLPRGSKMIICPTVSLTVVECCNIGITEKTVLAMRPFSLSDSCFQPSRKDRVTLMPGIKLAKRVCQI